MARRPSATGVRRRSPLGPRPLLFGQEQIEAVERAQKLAEQLVGDHHRLASFGRGIGWYEVCTLATAPREGPAPTALAKLTRYDRSERPIVQGQVVERFYRITVQDDNVLGLARREGFDVEALLVYVLVHELTHVARFERFQGCYDATGQARDREEAAVAELTAALARKVRRPEVDLVVSRMGSFLVDEVQWGG